MAVGGLESSVCLVIVIDELGLEDWVFLFFFGGDCEYIGLYC